MGFATNSIRTDLLDCFQAALRAVNGRDCVSAYFTKQTNLPRDQLAMVAIGKASFAMAEGAINIFGLQISKGLVITKGAYAGHGGRFHAGIEVSEGAHPVPDTRSLFAGQQLIGFLQGLAVDMPVVFLISGGTSALVEVLAEGVGLADLQRINRSMLGAGLSIGEMNRVRKRLSLIKGGGLLNYLGQRLVINILLSDVPGNDPAVIGSGLLVKSDQTIPLPQNLPEAIKDILTKLPHSETAICNQASVETVIIADNRQACEAAADCARQKGYAVEVHGEFLSDDVNDVAAHLIKYLNHAKPGIHIWGGEPTVCLPEKVGRGGRNQHLALLMANSIKQLDNLHILVAATDGSDGPGYAQGDDAGGLVDGQTIMRGEGENFSVKVCLDEANAGAFLEASGDLISTGPTGSNVADLIIAFKT